VQNTASLISMVELAVSAMGDGGIQKLSSVEKGRGPGLNGTKGASIVGIESPIESPFTGTGIVQTLSSGDLDG
jgi:hypothetical protein